MNVRRSVLIGASLLSAIASPSGSTSVGSSDNSAATCRSELSSTDKGNVPNRKALNSLEAKMAELHIPGLQVAVVKQGHIVMLASCGLADITFDQPVRRSTRFQLASATKPFTGVALMQLVEEGKIRLDNPIAIYLDDLPEDWRTVTVRQALMHVSGLPDIVRSDGDGSLIDPSGLDASWAKVKTLPTLFAPGHGYAYNQTNELLLGRIIEKFRGRPFTEVVKQREFDVAGMATATFSDTYVVVPGRATAYSMTTMVNGQLIPSETPAPKSFNYPLALRTGAGLTASAEEVARWLIALRDNKLIKPDTRKEMWTTGKMPDGRPTVWALGWVGLLQGQHPAVAGIGGNSVAYFWYPNDDAGVVILTNLSGSHPEQFVEQIAQLYR